MNIDIGPLAALALFAMGDIWDILMGAAGLIVMLGVITAGAVLAWRWRRA